MPSTLLSVARSVATVMALAATASVALAQDTSPPTASSVLHVRALAATCANCHGTNGKAPDGAAVVSLAGLPKAYIIQQMAAFKSGSRTPAPTVMHQLAKGYSDAQIDQLATYFAAQKK